MAANRKNSRGTVRRQRRGLKAVRKATQVKVRGKDSADKANKTRSKKPGTIGRGKAAASVAKKIARPIKRNAADLRRAIAEKAIKPEALQVAVAKPVGVTPVKAAAAIEAGNTRASERRKIAPSAGSEATGAAAAQARRPQQQAKPAKAVMADTEGLAPVLLSDQPPQLFAETLAAVVSLELLAGNSVEKRLRDDQRYTGLAGPDIVPLSRQVSRIVWAFELIDAISETSAVGTTRVFAIPNDKKEKDIELATFRNRLGHLVVQTRTTWKNDIPVFSLVSVAGGLLSQGDFDSNFAAVRLANDLYDPESIEKAKLGTLNRVVLNPAPQFPSAHDPAGINAFILGYAPAVFRTDAVAKIVDPTVPGAGSESVIDSGRRFSLRGTTAEMLSKQIPGDASAVKLEIGDAPGGSRKLTLTYRATREKSGDNTGTMAGAKNTDRMKLTDLVSSQPVGAPPIEAKDVPPVHLLLNSPG